MVLDLHFWSKSREDSFTNPQWRECVHSLWNSHHKTCQTSFRNTQENVHTQLKGFPVSTEARNGNRLPIYHIWARVYHQICWSDEEITQPSRAAIERKHCLRKPEKRNCLTNPGKWLIHVFQQ